MLASDCYENGRPVFRKRRRWRFQTTNVPPNALELDSIRFRLAYGTLYRILLSAPKDQIFFI